MASFNKVILLGNLTRDPELRYLPKGAAVCKFGVAVNRKWRTDTGENREEVTFADVEFFGKPAETITQHCKKGSSLLVEGRLKTDSWEDKQTGQKRSRLGIVGESFQFVGGKREDGGQTAKATSSVSSETPTESREPEDDDVPF